MKTALTSVLLATGLLIGGVAIAQPGGGECPQHEERGQARKAKAMERLKLTEEQEPLFEAVMTEMKEKRHAVKAETADPDERHAKMMALGQETEDKVAEFLTAEQLAEFQTMRAERMAKAMTRRAEMEAKKAETMERLNLTDDQRPQFEAILQEQRQAAHQLRWEAKADGERPDRDAMRALRDETDAKLATVLTPEQLDEWQLIKEERRAERREHKGKKGHGGKRGGAGF